MAADVVKRGYKCVRVLSIWDSPVAALVQVSYRYYFQPT